jgi:hypothetical protein
MSERTARAGGHFMTELLNLFPAILLGAMLALTLLLLPLLQDDDHQRTEKLRLSTRDELRERPEGERRKA